MKVNRNQAVVLKTAIQHWTDTGHLDVRTAEVLRDSIEVTFFDWKRLAKYSFWFAIGCTVISVSAFLADKALREIFELVFNAPHSIKFVALTLASAAIYWVGARRRTRYPNKIFSNEAVLFFGVLATAGAVYQLGMWLDTGSGRFSILLLLSSLIYGALGYFVRSNLIWLFSLISLGSWMGAETGYMSGWGAYYLGMNYPLRFVVFGGVLISVALLLERKEWFEHFFRTTLASGLSYFFIALWIVSIFGNYGELTMWHEVKQIQLFHWSIVFGLAACAAIYHGLRYGNEMTKGFGLTFLIINLYTRFFEYFWDATHKALFFAILGISFWFLGTKAEKIWQLGESKENKAS